MTDERNIPSRKVSPVAWVPTLYFAMGMPFVVLNMVCTLMYKGMGVSDAQIAFWTSLIMLPWTLKPLWSPFLEMYKTKKFFVVLTQLVSGIGFALVAFALHLPDFFAITIATLAVIALSGATHDIAADGTYMSVLSKEEQAKWIGWQGAFYNIAKIAATGGLVYLAGVFIKHFGVTTAWMVIMLIIAVIMCALGLYHIFILPATSNATSTEDKNLGEALRELWNVFADFFKKKHIVYYLFFIILYRFCEGFVMKIVPLFLKAPRTEQGLGLSEQEIGLCYGTFGAAAFVIGSILAGYYIAHRGLQKSLFQLALVFNLPFVAYTFLAIYQRAYWVGHHAGILRLWIRLCRTDALHDAADSAGQAPDEPLRLCLGDHEPRRHASRHAQRLPQRRPGLPHLLPRGAPVRHPRTPHHLVRAVHLS